MLLAETATVVAVVAVVAVVVDDVLSTGERENESKEGRTAAPALASAARADMKAAKRSSSDSDVSTNTLGGDRSRPRGMRTMSLFRRGWRDDDDEAAAPEKEESTVLTVSVGDEPLSVAKDGGLDSAFVGVATVAATAAAVGALFACTDLRRGRPTLPGVCPLGVVPTFVLPLPCEGADVGPVILILWLAGPVAAAVACSDLTALLFCTDRVDELLEAVRWRGVALADESCSVSLLGGLPPTLIVSWTTMAPPEGDCSTAGDAGVGVEGAAVGADGGGGGA